MSRWLIGNLSASECELCLSKSLVCIEGRGIYVAMVDRQFECF